MGQMLIDCGHEDPEIEIVGGVDVGDDLASLMDGCDALIDFSLHDASLAAAKICAENNKALIIGTTGHSDPDKAAILELTQTIPIVWASNFSTGVNALFYLTRKAAEILGPDFDLEVVEMHHRMKKDAPSGTASTLGEILAEVRGLQVREALRHGREGIVGERTKTEIGMHSLRGGDVVGDHTVSFATHGERVELTHKASSRATFAKGALRAAKWAVSQNPGLYDMEQVLGLK